MPKVTLSAAVQDTASDWDTRNGTDEDVIFVAQDTSSDSDKANGTDEDLNEEDAFQDDHEDVHEFLPQMETANITINDSFNVHHGNVNLHVYLSQEDDHLTDKSTVLLASCRRSQEIFVPTTAYKEAKLCLRHHSVVIILGNTGDGKTTLLEQLCLDMYKEGYLPLDVSSPDDIESYYRKGTKMFFVCDDPVGGPYLIQRKVDAWVDKGSSATKIPKYLQSGEVKIAFASRNSIWTECRENLEDLVLFQRKVQVSSYRLTNKEKLRMLSKHFGNKDVAPSASLIAKTASLDHVIAYPYSCSMVARHVAETSKIDDNDFIETFRRPFPLLRQEIKRLSRNDPLSYAMLILLMLRRGILPSSQLTDYGADETIKTIVRKIFHALVIEYDGMSLTKLRQSAEKHSEAAAYLIEHVEVGGDKSFRFGHDSVFEAVAIEYGQKHAEHLLEYCSPSFTVARFRLKSCKPTEIKDDHFIRVGERHYHKLANIFTWEIIGGNVLKVFSNPAVEDTLIQEHWIENIKQLPLDARTRFMYTEYVYYFASRKTKQLLGFLLKNIRRSSETTLLVRVIYTAAQRRHGNILKLLINNGVLIDMADEYGRSALGLAAYLGKHELVEILHRYGGNVNIKDETYQRTPLHYAAERDHLQVLLTLIKNSADVNQSDVNDRGPLHLSAGHGHGRIVSILLEKHADVDKKDHQNSTALHYAAEHGHVDAMFILIKHGADVNHVDNVKKTALHYASKNGHRDVVSVLLSNGAREGKEFEDYFGKSASAYAIDGDHDEIVIDFVKVRSPEY